MKLNKLSQQMIILGAGGHSRSVLSLLMRDMVTAKIAIWDIVESKNNGETENILGINVFKCRDWETEILNYQDAHFFIAFGDNDKRSKVLMTLNKHSLKAPLFISKSSLVHQSAVVHNSSVIFDKVYLGPLSVIHENCIINTGAIVEHETIIEKNSQISPGAILCGRVKIGQNCNIGAGAVVRDGVKICDNVTIGMGSIVTKSIITPGTYLGVPAKLRDVT